MRAPMSCSKSFGQEPDISDFITKTVRYFMRRKGAKRDEAIEQAALAFNVSPRKVWQIFYQEPGAPFVGGRNAARDSYLKHLEQRERDFEIAAEETRRERKQLELEI